MTGREWLESVRSATLTIREERDKIEQMRSMLGPHGRGGQFHGGTFVDPMRHVDSFVDEVSECERLMSDMRRIILTADVVRRGMIRMGADDAAKMLEYRYMNAEPWPLIAYRMKRTANECIAFDAKMAEWIDSIGIARLVDAGRGESN